MSHARCRRDSRCSCPRPERRLRLSGACPPMGLRERLRALPRDIRPTRPRGPPNSRVPARPTRGAPTLRLHGAGAARCLSFLPIARAGMSGSPCGSNASHSGNQGNQVGRLHPCCPLDSSNQRVRSSHPLRRWHRKPQRCPAPPSNIGVSPSTPWRQLSDRPLHRSAAHRHTRLVAPLLTWTRRYADPSPVARFAARALC